MYLIDDVTGELYACQGDELIAIKEQGYLQREMVEEKYLESQTGRRRIDQSREPGHPLESFLWEIFQKYCK